MEKGKLIVIEGTDCSGKETQTKALISYLEKNNRKVKTFSYPNYDSPTGKIIGGPYLGKPHICNGWFSEGAVNVDPKVASLYYAADRYYNKELIENALNEGFDVILDRYVYSNMAHQGSKIDNKDERLQMYKFIETLEFDLLQLKKADVAILLYMPTESAKILRENRLEKLDEHEMDEDYLKRSENAYLELAKLYNFEIINCANKDNIRTIEDISKDVIALYSKYN